MKLFLIFSLFSIFSTTEGLSSKNKNSTLGIRLSLSGLQFFSDIGHKIVNHELPRLTLPDLTLPISGGPGSGQVHVSDTVLQKFESPKFKFVLAPDEGITWHSRGGALRLSGKWKADYTVLVTVHLSGTVDVTANDIRSVLTLGAYGYNKHPQISVFNCTTEVKNLHMSLSGGVIPWIINLFKVPLSSAIKSAIHEQFCDLTRTVLLTEANNALMTLPTRVEITNNIYLDYGLINNPVITNKYVQGDALIDVTIGNRTCDVPFVPVKFVAPEGNNYMTNIWFSESIVNCILESAHEDDMLKFVIDKDLQRNLSQFLKTSCDLSLKKEICFGTFFKKLRKNYPNQYVDLVFKSGKAPNCGIESINVEFKTIFFIDIHINPYIKNPNPLARLEMTTDSTMEPDIFNDRIVGKLTGTKVEFKQISSTIGNFNYFFLKALEVILKPMITVAADTALRIGIPIPLVDNVTLGNSTVLVKLEKEIRVDANLIYVNNF